MSASFITGLVVGVSVAAPVGPIGVLVMQRTLAHGARRGLACGLGAALADGVYAGAAVLGLAAAAAVSPWLTVVLTFLAGGYLVYLGLKIARSRAGGTACVAPPGHWARDTATTFGLTLANPMTIVAFAAMLGVIESAGAGTGGSGLAAALGVMAGSAAWWIFLSLGVGLLAGKAAARLRLINLISGLIIAGFGLAALISAASGLWRLT